ncbi:hypothetical protein AD006_29570 (plasmid) [Pseudonocardia sp. EC080610-09]|uniref:hypothetical protein n=1 Tax=unclassified Pseudonocardia TaxID=2619320 RepID=UPI0007058EB8|nr:MULTISPECIES: hypothetical protein [unclassified Pseudonocardia]ALL79417.1 hypothetical protein AD006_29570 [Pseudonocardia sp. EC080610-09]ALL85630.1 hypothetical protein AD017_31680 [Pseudonocardia sp. EC080619-01]
MSFWDYLLIVDDGRTPPDDERATVEAAEPFPARTLDHRDEHTETLPVDPGPVGDESTPVPARELLRRLAAGEYDT